MKILFIIAQYLVPQHLLSRLVGKIADCEWPWLKNTFIEWFIKRYQVNMTEAADPEPRNYPNFNAFFTRALADKARSIDDADNSVVLPADGAISQIGQIEHGRIFQAKGQDYSLVELLGGDRELSREFEDGSFATNPVYLEAVDKANSEYYLSLLGVRFSFQSSELDSWKNYLQKRRVATNQG